MFNRLGTKGPLLAAVVLALIWGLSKVGAGNGKGTVRSVVVQVDTAQLMSVTIVPRRLKGATLEFQRKDGIWTVKDSTGTYAVDKASFDMALSGFQNMRTLRLGGSMSKHATKYELTDTARTSITFRWAGKEAVTVHCGSVNMEAREAGETFVNVGGEDEIHVVEGSVTRALDQPTSSWREHILIGGNPANWHKVQLRFGDGTGYDLARTGEKWTVGNEPADQERVGQFLKSLSKGSSSRYADKTDVTGFQPAYTITIQQSLGEPIVVEVFDTGTELVLIRRDRPELKFWLDRERDMSRLYRPAEYLLNRSSGHPAH